MASLIEEEVFEALVYLIEITDAVIGGANGIANLQAKQLANRTAWLKANKQDKDATLTALAALVTAADKMIYATGSDTFSTTTLTAFARTLLDDVDAAAMRATIGAQAAGSYQVSDATLTALAALVTAADKMIYATGSDTFSTTTLTAFARTLLDDVDAAAMRATLGIASSGILNSLNLLHIQDQKAANVTGGTPANGWNIRTLNTVLANGISGASLANPTITLPAGTYYCEGECSSMLCNSHRAALYNVTDGTYPLLGTSQHSRKFEDVYDAMATTTSKVTGTFTISATKTFQLKHYVTYGYLFGTGSASGLAEVYSDIKFWKVG